MVDLHSPECESGVHTECKDFSAQEGVLPSVLVAICHNLCAYFRGEFTLVGH